MPLEEAEPDLSWRVHLDMAREDQAERDKIAAVHQRIRAQELARLEKMPGRTRKRCAGIIVTNGVRDL